MTTREYIDTYKDIAIKHMKQYKIPASIKLAQGILESGNGSSRLAVQANNHFGIKCKSSWTGGKIYHDDDAKGECFRKYPSAQDSYADHSIFLSTSSRYATLFQLKITDYKEWAHGLKAAGYATNPKYAQTLIKIIEDFELYKFDDSKNSTPILTDEGVSTDRDVKGRKWGKNNGVKYVVAENGDTFETIAKQEKLNLKQILNYNDLKSAITLAQGTAIYIQPKLSKSLVTRTHIVEQGESTHSISQKYAITLDALKSMNPKLRRKAPQVGQRLKLSK